MSGIGGLSPIARPRDRRETEVGSVVGPLAREEDRRRNVTVPRMVGGLPSEPNETGSTASVSERRY
ncbi:hypothetical protein [Natrinema sp. SYSU A 869]|uniref:hypothetical protein n=1 Tax=Natrinema sp. SYSU A 869 TaxID=2871694 RepID=UPI001CA3FD4F|nr:hypothetical protein [Natrinema sp. SYSU A 869]